MWTNYLNKTTQNSKFQSYITGTVYMKYIDSAKNKILE